MYLFKKSPHKIPKRYNAGVQLFYYVEMLEDWMVPEMERIDGGRDYIFVQEGDRSHTSKFRMGWIRENINEIIEPEHSLQTPLTLPQWITAFGVFW